MPETIPRGPFTIIGFLHVANVPCFFSLLLIKIYVDSNSLQSFIFYNQQKTKGNANEDWLAFTITFLVCCHLISFLNGDRHSPIQQ